MGFEGLIGALEGIADFRDLLDRLRSEGAAAVELSPPPGARPLLAAAVWHRLRRPVLAVAPRAEDARRLYDALLTYLGDEASLHLLPEPDVLPFERLVSDAGTASLRLRVLWALMEAEGGGPPPLVVASTASLLRKTLAVKTFRDACQVLNVGQRVSLDSLLTSLARLGYRPEEGVEVPGTFSRRGGILDVFSPASPLPFRIELWGDVIESIRRFDPASQRSVDRVERAPIVPAREVLPALADPQAVSDGVAQMNMSRCQADVRERIQDDLARLYSGGEVEELAFYTGLFNHTTLLEHLPTGSLLVLERPADIRAEAEALRDQENELRAAKEARGDLPQQFPSPQVWWEEVEAQLERRPRLCLGNWSSEGPESLGFRVAPSFFGRVESFVVTAGQSARRGVRVVVVSRHARRLHELLVEASVPAVLAEGLDEAPEPGRVTVAGGALREGFSLSTSEIELQVFSDGEVFGTAKERGPRRHRTAVRHTPFLSELTPGSYVVHIDHGVARFAGTTHMGGEDGQPSLGAEGQREYLVLEYAEGDKIYVPTDHLDRVSPYVSSSDQPPTLTRLGTGDWSHTKERVKASAREMAQELLKLYARRARTQGRAFGPDTAWQRELEESFPYEETPDQARTIAEVKQDMETPRPMDRLVCGDVGYGKTEVALRAAFKAVADGVQVAVLVPTTVLAQQHYATFSERLKPFPVTVEVLSRFRTDVEQQQVIEGLKHGTVDIVIGTHRLLQKDVSFKNLGLVIVDEEQRFGVAHKETLKQMRAEVDVLTMSATPIPRTLHMALSGIRDMSTMETPPEERLPVRTYVGEFSPDLVKEAILRELERGGQVFFLHNRVRSIRRVAGEVQELVPNARIGVAHGRMDEGELEEVMAAFARGDLDVLVCTTIIESGLDVPNANTLIIDRADTLGLAQLYQLRGRVGRSAQRAYSYLFVPRGRRITEAAQKRLQAILEASELGAGFRIAMRDLEIRGAGNLLGAEQSGHIHAVGFELYTQLLQEAVADLQAAEAGKAREAMPSVQPRVVLPLSASVPESYVEHLPTRMAIYQKLARARTREDVAEVREELRDRFGPPPEDATNLLYVVETRVLAQEARVQSVTMAEGQVVLTLSVPIGGARLALEKALGPHARVGNEQVRLLLRGLGDGWHEELHSVLERLAAFQKQVEALVQPVPASSLSPR